MVEGSVDLRDGGWLIGRRCPDDKSDNGLDVPTEVGFALINEAGGQSGSGPGWGFLFLFGAFSLSLRDPSLNLWRKAFIFLVARAGVRRGSSKGPVERSSREKPLGVEGKSDGGDKTEERTRSRRHPSRGWESPWGLVGLGPPMIGAIEQKTRG